MKKLITLSIFFFCNIAFSCEDAQSGDISPIIIEQPEEQVKQILAPGYLAKTVFHHKKDVCSAAYNVSNDLFALSLWPTFVAIFNKADAKPKIVIKHQFIVLDVKFVPESNLVLTSDYSGKVYLWDIDKPEQPIKYFEHPDIVQMLDVTNDGKCFLAACADGFCYLWNIKDGDIVAEFKHPEAVRDVTISDDQSFIVTGSKDNKIRFFKMDNTNEPELEFECGRSSIFFSVEDPNTKQYTKTVEYNIVSSVAISQCGNYFAAGSTDRCARIFDTHTLQHLVTLEHKVAISCVAFLKNGDLITVADKIYVWDLDKIETPKCVINHHGKVVNGICASKVDNSFITASSDNRATLFEPVNSDELELAINPDVKFYPFCVAQDPIIAR